VLNMWLMLLTNQKTYATCMEWGKLIDKTTIHILNWFRSYYMISFREHFRLYDLKLYKNLCFGRFRTFRFYNLNQSCTWLFYGKHSTNNLCGPHCIKTFINCCVWFFCKPHNKTMNTYQVYVNITLAKVY